MKGIYAIFDTAAEEYVGTLQLHPKEASAVRFFIDLANDSQTTVSRYLKDHELHRLGFVDFATGQLTPGLQTIATGLQILTAREAEAAKEAEHGR